jgi:hypothetical protein
MVKNLWARFSSIAITFSLFLMHYASPAALFTGNGSGSGGGAVGNGTLSLTDNGTTMSGTFTKGTSGNFNDVLVIFVDSQSGGFTSTSSFSDTSTAMRRAICGLLRSDARSTANFAPGFTADYAIAISITSAPHGTIYHLGTGNLDPGFMNDFNVTDGDSASSPRFSFSFARSDIGLSSGAGFKFESSYITATGSRYLESFESTSGTGGFENSITFGNYDTYGISSVPEPVNTALAALGGITLTSGAVSMLRRRTGKIF